MAYKAVHHIQADGEVQWMIDPEDAEKKRKVPRKKLNGQVMRRVVTYPPNADVSHLEPDILEHLESTGAVRQYVPGSKGEEETAEPTVDDTTQPEFQKRGPGRPPKEQSPPGTEGVPQG